MLGWEALTGQIQRRQCWFSPRLPEVGLSLLTQIHSFGRNMALVQFEALMSLLKVYVCHFIKRGYMFQFFNTNSAASNIHIQSTSSLWGKKTDFQTQRCSPSVESSGSREEIKESKGTIRSFQLDLEIILNESCVYSSFLSGYKNQHLGIFMSKIFIFSLPV